MHQEPCGSETTTSGYSCASDGRLVWTSDSAEQAVSTPNDDEEMLEQMSHPKNKVMERMTPLERWNGLAWVCTVWLWKGLARGGVCSGTTMFPQTQHVRLVRFSLFGCDLTTSISSKGIQGQAMKNLRERTNRRLPRQLSKKYSTSRCFAQRSSRARGRLKRMDTDGLEELGFSQKKSPKKPINRMCLGEESTDEASRTSAPQDKRRQRWGVQQRQGVNVQST